jgi:hypothetical protein
MELKPHPEHEKDHPDLGELLGQVTVGDKSRSGWSDDDPSQQVTDYGRETEPKREIPTDQGRGKTAGQGHEEIKFFHANLFSTAQECQIPRKGILYPPPHVRESQEATQEQRKWEHGLDTAGFV